MMNHRLVHYLSANLPIVILMRVILWARDCRTQPSFGFGHAQQCYQVGYGRAIQTVGQGQAQGVKKFLAALAGDFFYLIQPCRHVGFILRV